MPNKLNLYIGTYTLPIVHGTGETVMGRGEGIYYAELDIEEKSASLRLVAQADNPSFLSLSSCGRRLYAVNELKEYEGMNGGAVLAYSINADGGLNLINKQPTHGEDPCHIALSPDGKTLIVSNYSGGSVYVCALLESGAIEDGGLLLEYEGSGPDSLRQKGPHAHSALFDGAHVYVCDLGTDSIYVYATHGAGRVDYLDKLKAKPGAGPRWCKLHPYNGIIYCINELDCTISAYRKYGEGFAQTGTYQALPDKRDTICASIRISPDGKKLYCSNRGHDSISAFTVEKSGALLLDEVVKSGGKTPRDFIIDSSGRYLIAANQDSDNITVFSTENGLKKRFTFSVPMPVCVTQAHRSTD